MLEQRQSIEDNESFGPNTSTEEDPVDVIDSIWPVILMENLLFSTIKFKLQDYKHKFYFLSCATLLRKTAVKHMR